MLSLKIHFSHPWYLLLLLLFFALTIIPYFTIPKKYRKTRNRITSMVLHGIVSLLVVFILSGMTFIRTTANSNNEIIMLVDVSNTERQSEEKRDKFIKTVIEQCKFDKFKLGIVTFGYDQEYAVKLTTDYNKIYDKYKDAKLPDTSATNIASSLLYTKDLFTTPGSGKIVLITDGKETDENAKSIIEQIASTGIIIDTVNIATSYNDEKEIQINGIKQPDYHINVGEECTLAIDIYSSYEGKVNIELYDNGENQSGARTFEVKPGIQTFQLNHIYKKKGLHELKIVAKSISEKEDIVEENNEYISYFYLDVYNKILILEQEEGQSTKLVEILETNQFDVSVLNLYNEEDATKLPTTIEQLCEYDEVIMNNIANKDLPVDFVPILNEYVYTYGGGLFTTGGSDLNGDAHAYSRVDMYGTMYQEMLPIQAVNYKPPVGVMVIIDRSGSMGSTDQSGNSLLEWAKAGASSCLNVLTDKDYDFGSCYFGLMTLDSDYDFILPLTSTAEKNKIQSAINSLDKAEGATIFPGAIDSAGRALRALKSVSKKHIIIVTDGAVPQNDVAKYEEYAKNYSDTDGITISVVGVSMSKVDGYEKAEVADIPTDSSYCKMLRLTKLTGGRLYVVPRNDEQQLALLMREDLQSPEIQEINQEEFYPIMEKPTSPIFNGVERLTDETSSNRLTTMLTGFYGVKIRSNDNLIIKGKYNVPIYAQWKFGKGTVGSLMIDVYGLYSEQLLNDINGKKLITNIVAGITPTQNIRSNSIGYKIFEDNYSNILGIYTPLNKGEKVIGSIEYGNQVISLNTIIEDMSIEDLRNLDCYVLTALSPDNDYSRAKFIIRTPGVYKIKLEKYDAEDYLIDTNIFYKDFTYSKEFDIIDDGTVDYDLRLKSYAVLGKGRAIEDLGDPHEIIDSFNPVLTHIFNPTYLFAILAIICFLLDIAVRKFKFKWPHELIKAAKEKNTRKR